MADLMRIRASDHGTQGITWDFVDSDMTGYKIELEQAVSPEMRVQDGDVWRAQLVERFATPRNNRRVILRLITREREVQPFEKIDTIPGFWMPAVDLRCILIWFHENKHVILVGSKGTGKSTFGYMLAEAMGWQVPCKVEIAAVKRAEQLFGSNTANGGTTGFNKSYLLEYIERAIVAHQEGLSDRFLVILDEWNRAHAKIKSALHGCFDKTRQITIPTEEGSRTIIVPSNVSFIATANMGAEYAGTFSMDDADKSRFVPVRVQQMPEDVEVAMLSGDTDILESQALKIVQIAGALRRAATGRQISYGPSYREVEATAVLVKHGVDLKTAVWKAMLGYYEGDRDESGEPLQPNSEYAKAYAALTMKGATLQEVVAEDAA